MTDSKKVVIGLIGLPGAGKSTVAAELERLGAHIIDADQLGHSALLDKNISERLREHFGDAIFSEGEISRSKLADRVFTNPADLDFLESIVHPYITEKVADAIRTAAQPMVVVDAALLNKSPLRPLCKHVLLVSASLPARLSRVQSRGWSESELQRRDKAVEPHLSKFDFIINADNDLETTDKQARFLYDTIMNERHSLGIYAGSFDPVTNGHLWMIERGSKIFKNLIVAIGINPGKKSTFPLQERVEMLQEITRHLPNVVVDTFENEFLVNYAGKKDADYILRGIRSEVDFEYEQTMRHINSDLNSKVTTVFLIPPRALSEVSSSMVKGLVGPEDWENIIDKYVPKYVLNLMYERFRVGFNRWKSLCERLGAGDRSQAVYEALLNSYREPRRYYHNIYHVWFCLRSLDEFFKSADFFHASNAAASNINKDIVELAVWFHDAVYDFKGHDNEEKSAEFVRKFFSDCLDAKALADVERLIMATKHIKSPASPDEALIMDVDISSLAQPSKQFDEMEDAIRREYSFVTLEEFRKGRSAILQKLLDRPRLFFTDFFRDRLESSARTNMRNSKYRE